MRYRISDSQYSARVRLGTERADFFLVIDYYLAQEQVRTMLDTEDFDNYKRLERRDRVMRAANLFITGRTKQADELVQDIFSWHALASAVNSKRGAFVLLIGVYVKLLILLNLNKIGKTSLAYIKQVTRK